MINANLVNRTRLGERRLMVLLRGVCRGLKAMHQYRVGETGKGGGGVGESKKVRGQAQRADREMEEEEEEVEANSSRRRQRRGGGDDQEQEPLMEDEMTAAQRGHGKGEIRAYAHRDIKPGKTTSSSSS